MHRDAEADLRRFKVERERLESERTKLMQAHYKGAVPIEVLRAEQSRLTTALGRVVGSIEELERDWDQIEDNLSRCLNYLTNCQAVYANASNTLRRQLNQALFDCIEVHEDETVSLN